MVTAEEVWMAYRILLGRDPESAAVVQGCRTQFKDLMELREAILSCPEFKAIASNHLRGVHSFSEPEGAIQIQVNCKAEHFDKLLSRVHRTWSKLGETEPMWSVLTADRFKCAEFPAHSAAFYQSARHDVDRYIAWLMRNGLALSEFKSCLEFGCGVGRVTRRLAEIIPRVIGCDISKSHLKLAGEYLKKEEIKNVELRHVETLRQLEGFTPVDAIFSVIVLQHNPPPVIARILNTLFRLLRRKGVAYFQVPTYQAGYTFDINHYLNAPPTGQMEMHVLPQKYVFALAAENRCSVLEVQPDHYTGIMNGISNTFLVRKE